jgi:hypothetical protein
MESILKRQQSPGQSPGNTSGRSSFVGCFRPQTSSLAGPRECIAQGFTQDDLSIRPEGDKHLIGNPTASRRFKFAQRDEFRGITQGTQGDHVFANFTDNFSYCGHDFNCRINKRMILRVIIRSPSSYCHSRRESVAAHATCEDRRGSRSDSWPGLSGRSEHDPHNSGRSQPTRL